MKDFIKKLERMSIGLLSLFLKKEKILFPVSCNFYSYNFVDILNVSHIPATTEQYAYWFTGFINNGGIPTHYYDYSLHVDTWWFVSSNQRIYEKYGALSKNYIIHEWAVPQITKLGHNNIYMLKDFSYLGHRAPMFTDVHALLKGKAKDLVDKFKIEYELKQKRILHNHYQL